MTRITDTVKHLIIINVILFLIPQFVYPELQNLFALHFPKSPEFGLWQYITSMFMHSQQSFMHIAFNMFGLYMFGSPLEQLWGRNKFLFFYFSAGIGAGIIYTLVNYYQFNSIYNDLVGMGIGTNEIQNLLMTGRNSEVFNQVSEETLIKFYGIFNTPAVGASGALYGVLAAFGMRFPNAKLALIFFPVPIAAKFFIPVLIGIDLFSGLTGFSIFGSGNIAHFAHVGGALVGFIIMLFWKDNQFKRWDR